jgi:hypothetical protein
MSSKNQIQVVFISGFLTPTNWQCYPTDIVPSNVNMIQVFPSPTGSLHDRACQVFYELFGGTIDYGQEHSDFHGHARYGKTFAEGKVQNWSKDNPIVIVGYSCGGLTAWILQNYLASKRFPGVDSEASWISGILCLNTPLNGALAVYSKGMDLCHAPVARWGSTGCIIGWFAQWTEYFDLPGFKKFMDFQQGLFEVMCKLFSLDIKYSLFFFY